MNRTRVLNGLVASRLAFGTATWALPGPVGRAFGFELTRTPEVAYLARLFGSRDIALAVGLFAASDQARRSWLLAGMACDVADTAASMTGAANGLSRRTTGMLLLASLSPLVRGMIALRESRVATSGAVALPLPAQT